MDALARKPNVLFVDDEPRVLTSMRALFRRDYNVYVANSGSEALELLETRDVDVIVSDQRMPGLTGVDVLKAFKTRAPRAMRILLTGYADKDAITASINEGEVFRYLTKPCPRDTLRETIELAVSAAGFSSTVVDCDTIVDGDAGTRLRAGTTTTAERSAAMPAAVAAPASGGHAPADPGVQPGTVPRENTDVELLVLTSDREFGPALLNALAESHVLHVVENLPQALEALEKHAIGVFITDIAVQAEEIQTLTAQLKHQVPELVTIVASDHSDAHRLIELINSGQVFRFLLKPIRPKQTSIWIESAVGKHMELVRNPALIARHTVAAPTRSLKDIGEGFLKNLSSRISRLRLRATAR